eukprot:scaffold128343_cov30-Tisochrysis_lutea.AAC.2
MLDANSGEGAIMSPRQLGNKQENYTDVVASKHLLASRLPPADPSTIFGLQSRTCTVLGPAPPPRGPAVKASECPSTSFVLCRARHARALIVVQASLATGIFRCAPTYLPSIGLRLCKRRPCCNGLDLVAQSHHLISSTFVRDKPPCQSTTAEAFIARAPNDCVLHIHS